MKKRVRLLVSLLVISVVISSCSTNTTNTVEAPVHHGTLAGRIVLYDTGSISMTDYSGVVVSIDSTGMKAVTDSFGNWRIDGVAQGQYNITASKDGFGAYHWFEQLVDTGRYDLATISLGKMSNVTPTLLSAIPGSPLALYAKWKTPPYYIVLYCDLDSTVQPQDAHLAVSQYYSNPGYVDSVYCGFTNQDLLTAGVRSGQTIYYSASTIFTVNTYAMVSYYDPIHHETRWVSTGPKSNVVKVVMP